MLNTTAIGHLGKDAEIKVLSNGRKVINFSIAHSEKWKDAAGVPMSRTIWIECALWERPNLAPYLKKGTAVWVSGTPSVNAYMSKQDGKPAASLRLNVFQVELVGGKKDGDSNAGNSDTSAPGDNVDDLPF